MNLSALETSPTFSCVLACCLPPPLSLCLSRGSCLSAMLPCSPSFSGDFELIPGMLLFSVGAQPPSPGVSHSPLPQNSSKIFYDSNLRGDHLPNWNNLFKGARSAAGLPILSSEPTGLTSGHTAVCVDRSIGKGSRIAVESEKTIQGDKWQLVFETAAWTSLLRLEPRLPLNMPIFPLSQNICKK